MTGNSAGAGWQCQFTTQYPIWPHALGFGLRFANSPVLLQPLQQGFRRLLVALRIPMEIVSPSGGGDVSALAENVIVQADDRNTMRGGQTAQEIKTGVAASAHSGFSEDYVSGAYI